MINSTSSKHRILVTGGLGFVGSHVCVELLNAGYCVAILDNFYNSDLSVVNQIGKITGQHPLFFEGDIRDKNCLQNTFRVFSPDAVIHCAGLKAVSESVEQPLRYYEWNVAGSINLLQVMDETNVRVLVFSSSATVYGLPSSSPVVEDTTIAPNSPYGNSKVIIEQILADLLSADPAWRIARLRYFNPVGAHRSSLIGERSKCVPNNLMPYVVKVAAGILPEVKVFGSDYATPDGTGVRDYIHVVDLAEGHLAALSYIENKTGLLTVNLGTGQGYSVLEMIHAMGKASNKKIPYKLVGRRSGDVAQCVADVSKAQELLGWKANLSLDEMCHDLWNWQSNQV